MILYRREKDVAEGVAIQILTIVTYRRIERIYKMNISPRSSFLLYMHIIV